MPKIYLITPQESAWEGVKKIIAQICNKLGLELFQDSECQSSAANRKLLLENSAFVIADISSRTSNIAKRLEVCYEIGYAQRAQKSILLIAQNNQDLPDLGQKKILLYTLEEKEKFAKDLIGALMGMCRLEKVRYYRFRHSIEEWKEDVLPVLPRQDQSLANYSALGDSLIAEEKYEQAYEEYSKAILRGGTSELQMHHAFLFVKRAFVDKKLGNIEEALADYSQAIEIKKDYVDAYVSRGIALYESKKYEMALEDFRQASELKPDFPRIYVLMGSMNRILGRYEEALGHLNKAIELSPQYSQAFFTRAQVYVDCKEFNKAIEDYSQVIAIDKEYVDAYLKRGIVFMKIENLDKAMEDFNKVIALSPENFEAYDYRGQVLFAKAHKEYHQLAISDWQKAIDLGSKNHQQLTKKISLVAHTISE